MENHIPPTQAPKPNMMQLLASTPPARIADLPEVEQRFIQLRSKTSGVSLQVAEVEFQQEKYHMSRMLSESAGLRECEGLSLYGCFLDCAVQGLSLDPKKKLCYIIPGSVNIGTKDQKQWVKRATLEISPYGELAIRQQKGQIKYADNPVIVYEGDLFEPYEDANGKGVVYKPSTTPSNKIIAAFLKIVRVDGTIDYHWMFERDWMRLAGYSSKKNNGYANALYTSCNGGIDPGFLSAKLIKHAFRSYPKVNLVGQFSQLATAKEIEEEPTPEDIYGKDITAALPQAAAPVPASTLAPNTIAASAQILNNENVSHEAKMAAMTATATGEMSNETVTFRDDTGDGF